MRLSFASATLYFLLADTPAGTHILDDPLTDASDRRCSPRSRMQRFVCTGRVGCKRKSTRSFQVPLLAQFSVPMARSWS